MACQMYLTSGTRMGTVAKTPNEIARLIVVEAVRQIGPWPDNLDVFIFRTDHGWECLVTPTGDPCEAAYREEILEIGRTLEQSITLKA
jgi:hypothetical protein